MLRALAKRVLLGSGSLRLAARFRSRAALILMYHSVRDNQAEDDAWIAPGITHSTRLFARQMELVARRYDPVSLGEILSFLRGETTLRHRPIAVTFDDGYLDNVQQVVPVLKRFGIPGAFYLATGVIGTVEVPWFCRVRHAFLTTNSTAWQESEIGWDLSNPASRGAAMQAAYDACASLGGEPQRRAVDRIERELGVERGHPDRRLMMNWEEAKAVGQAGHIVGSHTVSHPNVAHVTEDGALLAELAESKIQIETHLGDPVLHFSYPHPALSPQWNLRTLDATRRAGYTSAITTSRGPVRKGANPLLLTRLGVPHSYDEFRWVLERAFAF